MAKRRYHQSMADRFHEAVGTERYDADRGMEKEHDMAERAMYRKHKGIGPEFYAGADPRRRQELRDAQMIQENHRNPSNLPHDIVWRPYSDAGGYLPEDIDDTIAGVDRQMNYDGSQRNKGFYPKKV